MTSIVVSVDIGVPLAVVWDAVSDLKGHERWMGDVESIGFGGSVTSGPGAVMDVATRVGPFRLTDRMTVTVWEPPHRIGVEHQGLVTGTGEFALAAIGGATRLTWSEDLRFPPYLGGQLAGLIAGPVLAAIWRRNLGRLRRLLETAS